MGVASGTGVWIEPIADVRSPFEEKFGIPCQPGLVPHAQGEVLLREPYCNPGMLSGLDGFSHIWLTFRFDRCVEQGWRTRVRPPRLGGNVEVGVWASRAPFRPNFLGLSVVRLLEVVIAPQPLLRVAGLDLLDGTPVYDIKPYLPYADALPEADGGFAATPPAPGLPVCFAQQAELDLAELPNPAAMRALVAEVLALDPRPAYRQGAEPNRIYGMRLAGRDVRWRVGEREIDVLALAPCT